MVPQALHGKEGQIINAKISSLIEAYWTSRLQLVYRYFRSYILVFILRCHDFSFCIHWREASNSVIKQSDDIYSLFENRSRLRHSYSSSIERKEPLNAWAACKVTTTFDSAIGFYAHCLLLQSLPLFFSAQHPSVHFSIDIFPSLHFDFVQICGMFVLIHNKLFMLLAICSWLLLVRAQNVYEIKKEKWKISVINVCCGGKGKEKETDKHQL